MRVHNKPTFTFFIQLLLTAERRADEAGCYVKTESVISLFSADVWLTYTLTALPCRGAGGSIIQVF